MDDDVSSQMMVDVPKSSLGRNKRTHPIEAYDLNIKLVLSFSLVHFTFYL